MRQVLAACTVSIVLAACGDSGSDNPPLPQCPAPAAPSGTLAGSGGGLGTFTPAEMEALVAGPTTCTVFGNTVSVAGIFLGFTSYQGICNLLTQYGVCFDKANGTIVGVQIANASVPQLPAQVPGPGTYAVGTVGTTVTSAGYSRTGASCASPARSSANDGDTITIDAVTSTQVTGSANLTFADGSTLSGTFTAARPQVSVNVCQLANQIAAGCTTRPCVQ